MRRVRTVLFVLYALSASTSFCDDFQFVVIGDTRPRFKSESFRPFETLIAKINELKPALIINVGDLIYGYGFPGKETQWDRYQSVIKKIQAPYYQLPGNHDTHSKSARRIYGRRFGKFYESFDYADCHFVLLDNTERQRWGYLGKDQLEWLRSDLSKTRARSVFVFMHFPVWEPDRITPEYYEFWEKTLHPLFKANHVRAVFAGHYHTYGPTREYDGISYFITGGGGAELIPEYRKSGGQFHFMKMKVAGEKLDARVVTESGELADPEADIMGGLLFASKHVSRIGIKSDATDLSAGVTFNVSVKNTHNEAMLGEAKWIYDSSAFTVEPLTAAIQIPAGASHEYSFTLKCHKVPALLESLPRLQFRVAVGQRIVRFHREVRILQESTTPFLERVPILDGKFQDWSEVNWISLGQGREWQARFSSSLDDQNLYLALSIPVVDTEETEELGFMDELELGFARGGGKTDFHNSFLRFGFKSGSPETWDRAAGRKREQTASGIKMYRRESGLQKCLELAIPLRLLGQGRTLSGDRIVMDVSFPIPEERVSDTDSAAPPANTLSYRVRYGSDSLVPVSFIELKLGPKPPRR
jgi:hypothetical protein